MINEKIKHLSETQINELIEKYYNTSIKVKDLIKEYEIDISVGSFRSILPPVESDKMCKYCNKTLYNKVPPRNGYETEIIYFCYDCGHKEIQSKWGRTEECKCSNCIKLKEEERLNKIKLIEQVYRKEYDYLEFDELSFEDKYNLIFICIHNPNHNTSLIEPISIYDGEINEDEWIEKLNRLNDIGAIRVSPSSDIDAFDKKDFPCVYYVNKVRYDIYVKINDEIIEQINARTFFIHDIPEPDLILLLKKIIYNDLIAKFERMMNERRLELHISEKANMDFLELIDKLSYSKILGLCEAVAKFFSDNVITGNISKSIAKNAALGNVTKFYNKRIESGWDFIDKDLEVGNELRFYIEFILGKNINLLRQLPTMESIINCEDFDGDYRKRKRRTK